MPAAFNRSLTMSRAARKVSSASSAVVSSGTASSARRSGEQARSRVAPVAFGDLGRDRGEIRGVAAGEELVPPLRARASGLAVT